MNKSVIRFLAGSYLAYLAFQLYKGIFTEMTDTTLRVIFFLFATLFLAIGVLLMVFVIRAELKKSKGGDHQDDASQEELPEPDTETTDNEE